MLEYEFLECIPCLESPVILLDKLEFDVCFLWGVVLAKLQVSDEILCVLIEFYLELTSFRVVAFYRIGLIV